MQCQQIMQQQVNCSSINHKWNKAYNIERILCDNTTHEKVFVYQITQDDMMNENVIISKGQQNHKRGSHE